MTKPLRTAEVIGAFIVSRQALGLSQQYIDWLKHMLRHLAAAKVLPTLPSEIDLIRSTLKPGRRGRNGPQVHLGDETRYGVHIAMQTLYNWAAEEYGCPNPVAKLRKPKRMKKVPRTTSAEQFSRLIESARGHPRDYAILSLIWDVGPRIGEITNLTRDNIQLGTVRLVGKTGWHEVPISPETHRALMRLPDGKNIWIGTRGPLTVAGMKGIVTRRLRRAGLPHGGPHMLRHTFGKLWCANGGNLVALQQMLGHSSIEMTRKYTALDLSDVIAQHARHSPAARLYLVPNNDTGEAAAGGS